MKYEVEILGTLGNVGQPQERAGFYLYGMNLYIVHRPHQCPCYLLPGLPEFFKPLASTTTVVTETYGNISEDTLLKVLGMAMNNDVAKAVFK